MTPATAMAPSDRESPQSIESLREKFKPSSRLPIFIVLEWMFQARQVCAHMLGNANEEVGYYAISSHLGDIARQMPFLQIDELFFLGSVSTNGKFVAFLVTLPIIGLNLWKYRRDNHMWRRAVIGAATAAVASYAIYPLIGPFGETPEVADRQFAVWIGYSTVLMASWLAGWIMLAASMFFQNAELRRIGVSALLVSLILQWDAELFWHMAPLHQIWWS